MIPLFIAILCMDPPDVAARETVAVLAGALAETNAEKFLAQLSPELKAQIGDSIRALLLQNEVTSSIAPFANDGDASKRVLQLDWYLEIRSKSNELALERRRQNVTCTVEMNAKKKWRVTAIDPVSLFDPPAVR